MARNRQLVAGSRDSLNKFKMETASEIGVNLNQTYNGDITAKQAGHIGGQMVKKLITIAEQNLK